MTVTIHDVLDDLRSNARSEREKGDLFERLIAQYLRTDPKYAAQFSDVWMWNDWPDRNGAPDTGIDLVAKDRYTGEHSAIQCKFYAETHHLQKSDIDSFFTASGKAPFSQRLIVSTTDHWTSHAEAALEGQLTPVARLRVQDLDQAPIDWADFSLKTPEVMERTDHKALRPHQLTALENIRAGFEAHDRGKMIMACGTGKTFTSLKIVEDLVKPGGTVLFLVPSISLMSQSLSEWTAEADVPLRTFAVCSDIKVGKRKLGEDIGPYDLAIPATTNAAKLVERASTGDDSDRITVVFSTYQSIQVISEAQGFGLGDFDLIVCDEAHRTTGVTLMDQDESNFVK
ncbi:MAG: DEAD/DEAH box helicase family protein, partial [Actinomycetota bacterium]|nr:DEAD/DEAH box helicase family protein [Actinomycetota bacterium]